MMSCVVIIAVIIVAIVWQQTSTEKTVTLYGNVDIRTVNSSFRVSGRLVALLKDEGALVQKGTLLAKLDNEPYQIEHQKAVANLASTQAQLALYLAGYRQEEIAQAKAQVQQFQAAYDYAESNYQRQLKLINTAAISKDQFDSSKTQYHQAKANLQSAQDKLAQLETGFRVEEIDTAKANVALAQAMLQQAELNLKDAELIAPTNGTILTRAIEEGTLVNAGTPVYAISLASPIWIRAYVDEVNLSQVEPGQRVYIYIDGRNQPYFGKIGFISPTAEFTPKTVETEQLRTNLVYRLRIQVNENGEGSADNQLRQGMPVTIKLAAH